MKRISLFLICFLILGGAAMTFTKWTSAQSSNAARRITQAIDESQLVTLKGNTHPSARPQFDQGAAPPDLPAEKIMLLLRSGPERYAAFETLLAQQQDRSSPNYHKWLTPDEFGQQFGANESDIQTITSWLQSHGFTIDKVSRGRTLIMFSGTASNVQDAFHTEIHKYFVNGEEHWANASDPQIPAALAPAVVGPVSLHNFRARAMHRHLGTFTRDKATRKFRPVQAQFTFGSGCGPLGGDCFLLGPGDFTKIYEAPTASTGGQTITIGIVNDSEININDAQNFYSIFGISRSNPNQIVPPTGTAPNPLVQPCPNGDECEADIDTQWAGSVAPGATVDLVVSASTNVTNGQNVALEYMVDTGGATYQIISMSFGACEASLGNSGNAFFGGTPTVKDSIGEWAQAAGEGISVVVSSGDQGSAGCENPDPNLTIAQPATTGLAVNGIASTPYNTAIGGTDFNDFNDMGQFWSAANTAGTQVSASGYIPETTWNDSCTNTIWTNAVFGLSNTPQANCNSLFAGFQTAIVPQGGGGGASTVYSKPNWQTGTGVPADGQRDVPDLSLFAGTGLENSFYAVCVQDEDTPVTNPVTPCNINPGDFGDIQGFGGTSVSTAAFAGVVALIDQVQGGRVGLLNPELYTLAATDSCTSAAPIAPATNPPLSCVFNDITAGVGGGATIGTNAQPCVLGTPDCSGTNQAIAIPSKRTYFRATTLLVVLACLFFISILYVGCRRRERDWSAAFAVLIFALFMACAACGGGGGGTTVVTPTNGILTGFNAGVGYDQATGLGSVNVQALINDF